jgi:hypothetical protein
MEGPVSKKTKETQEEGKPQREHQVPQQVCREHSQLQMCFNFHQQICALFVTNYKLNMVELNLIDFNSNSIEENQNAN